MRIIDRPALARIRIPTGVALGSREYLSLQGLREIAVTSFSLLLGPAAMKSCRQGTSHHFSSRDLLNMSNDRGLSYSYLAFTDERMQRYEHLIFLRDPSPAQGATNRPISPYITGHRSS